jgi:hypothetical protein
MYDDYYATGLMHVGCCQQKDNVKWRKVVLAASPEHHVGQSDQIGKNVFLTNF